MSGIYIHIPFCKSRCTYCDFYSTVASPLMERYVAALVSEAHMRISELNGDSGSTIYIGGGTPSQLPVPLMRSLMSGIRQAVDANEMEWVSAACQEFTVEVNPDDVTASYITALAQMGVNRISMGLQTFDDDLLRLIGRRHTAQQAIQAVRAIRLAGINNVSIDLIFGLPGQTIEAWRQSLDMALSLHPEHLSAYALSYEPGTVLWRQREQGKVREVDEETSVAMYAHLMTAMRRAGYEHYEISNFALPGRRSRHNSSYWTETPYLGLGASAHSYDGQLRRHNPADIVAYVSAIERGESPVEVETLEPWERYDERVMVTLRTCEGIDMAAIERDFGPQALQHLQKAAQPHIIAGNLRQNDAHLILTQQGIMTSDAIIRDLMF
ncbi:MAG: radical SAM family heme chaperone HemW [Muribaculaceae bacterium]|nr:radical SAM family heme chaperone HemW [Muribaculaceae bacterium]